MTQSVEEQLLELWDMAIVYDREMPLEAMQKLIAATRVIMKPVPVHDFLVGLKKELKARSLGHPTTKRLIRLLEIETEMN